MSKRKSISSFKSRATSIAVLVGFLCIQFHSFSHINLSALTGHDKTHQTENAFSQIDEPSSHEKNTHIECPECVLTKHMQADVDQNVVLHLSHSFQITAVHQDEPVFKYHQHFYHLRAPPIYTV